MRLPLLRRTRSAHHCMGDCLAPDILDDSSRHALGCSTNSTPLATFLLFASGVAALLVQAAYKFLIRRSLAAARSALLMLPERAGRAPPRGISTRRGISQCTVGPAARAAFDVLATRDAAACTTG